MVAAGRRERAHRKGDRRARPPHHDDPARRRRSTPFHSRCSIAGDPTNMGHGSASLFCVRKPRRLSDRRRVFPEDALPSRRCRCRAARPPGHGGQPLHRGRPQRGLQRRPRRRNAGGDLRRHGHGPLNHADAHRCPPVDIGRSARFRILEGTAMRRICTKFQMATCSRPKICHSWTRWISCTQNEQQPFAPGQRDTMEF
jgi:hypothetical protein